MWGGGGGGALLLLSNSPLSLPCNDIQCISLIIKEICRQKLEDKGYWYLCCFIQDSGFTAVWSKIF